MIKIQPTLAERISIDDESLMIDFVDGRSVSVPLEWYPRLLQGTPQERNNWRLIGRGEGIHWPDLDEDISIENVWAGRPSGESQRSLKRWLEARNNKRNEMNPTKVMVAGEELPEDFPSAAYGAVQVCMQDRRPDNEDLWDQYGGAWNAVAYRYLTCAESDEAFTQSIKDSSSAPPAPHRYEQERNLFLFFVAGWSSLEAFCYGIHAIAAFINPEKFPMGTASDHRVINPERTCDRLQVTFPDEQLTKTLKSVLATPKMCEWKEIRNILIHRTHPGREIRVGGPLADPSTSSRWKVGIDIDVKTTSERRSWLSDTLGQLLGDAANFAQQQLP